jgi:alpha-L-fucosidase
MQHPLRDTGDWAELNATRDMATYRAYLHAQVRELLTNYGKIDYLFFDFTYAAEGGKYPVDWDAETLLALCRELQPTMIVNDRLGIPGDLVTPEQYQPARPMTDAAGNPVRWEACQTTNGSWGYDRDNLDFKSTDLLLRMLVDSVGKNGNLLLNVGPDGRGGLRREDVDSLQAFADWMELHADSVHGAGAAEGIEAPQGTILTRRGDRLYIHLTTWPMQHLHVSGLAGKVRFARMLNDGSEIRFTTIDPDQQAVNTTVGGLGADVVTFTLPIRRPDVLLPVIEVHLDTEGGEVAFGDASAHGQA